MIQAPNGTAIHAQRRVRRTRSAVVAAGASAPPRARSTSGSSPDVAPSPMIAASPGVRHLTYPSPAAPDRGRQ